MEGRVAVVAALVVAVTLATVPTGGLAQPESSSVAPGERFAAVVGVQETEIQGAVVSRAFEVRFERAGSDAARAAVIADRIERTRERLQELQERKQRLREARENGTISEGQYRARIARLVAESNALQQQLNRTAEASDRVPDRALRQRGVDPAELERLRAAAGNLTGPGVAAIARNITGDGAGPPAGVGPGEERPGRGSGPPVDAGNRSDGGDGRERGEQSGEGQSKNADGRSSDAAGGNADGQSSDAAGGTADSGSNDRSGNRSTGSGGGGDGADRGDGSGRGDGSA